MSAPPVIAICGKGGVGKTVVCALLARAVRESGVEPLLLIDADPVSGLVSALGETTIKTIGDVRRQVIEEARHADGEARAELGDRLDYLVMEALAERDGYALFAMGRKHERGCFCPVNALLRGAIDLLVGSYAAVLIDAEAGVEQLNREVTRRVSELLVVVDGSRRSAETLAVIRELAPDRSVRAILNRARVGDAPSLVTGISVVGSIPEDPALRQLDQQGRPLWELSNDAPSMKAARAAAHALGLVPPPSGAGTTAEP